MKRLLPLMIVLIATLFFRGEAELRTEQGSTGKMMQTELSGTAKDVAIAHRGKLASITDTQQGRRNEATLNDARVFYRLYNTRPQRLLPTLGSKTGKSTGRLFVARRFHIQPFLFLHDGRRRLETAPFQSLASRDYYVIALRRILC